MSSAPPAKTASGLAPYSHVNTAHWILEQSRGWYVFDQDMFSNKPSHVRESAAKVVEELSSLPFYLGDIANSENWRVDRLLETKDGRQVLRKPRIRIWAVVNAKDSLTVYWLPVLDKPLPWGLPNPYAEQQFIAANSDFLVSQHDSHTTRPVGALIHATCVMRGLQHHLELRHIIVRMLANVLEGVTQIADVEVGDWPVLDGEGRGYWMQSARNRSLSAWKADYDAAGAALAKAGADIEEQLAKLGGLTLAEFISLAAKASRDESLKLSRLLFETTGKKVAGPALQRMSTLVAAQAAADERVAALKEVGEVMMGESAARG